jgi:methyl-accepting chemotaxis protein
MRDSVDLAVASIDQLSRGVHDDAGELQRVQQVAQRSATLAGEAGATVDQMAERMVAINGSSRRMAEIVGLIDAITFQTNILALNAAVEAARAGEQGRAFAMVASEVRSLAKRSQQAALDIRNLVQSAISEVDAGARLPVAAADPC